MNAKDSNHIWQAVSDEEMQALGGQLAKAVQPGVVIYLCGPLGAGKTTFTRGFLRSLGYHGKVKSPTYTLVEPYETEKLPVFHFDLYRIENAKELEHVGIEEYFSSDAVCLIEWPEKGQPLLPLPDLTCYIEKVVVPSGKSELPDPGRQIRLVARTESGDGILARL